MGWCSGCFGRSSGTAVVVVPVVMVGGRRWVVDEVMEWAVGGGWWVEVPLVSSRPLVGPALFRLGALFWYTIR